MKSILIVLGLYLAFLACGPESSKKEPQSLLTELPPAPPHVSQYVTFKYILVCGSKRFSKTEVEGNLLVIQEVKGLESGSKCFLEASGDPGRFLEQHKDAIFEPGLSNPNGVPVVFYRSSESVVKDGKNEGRVLFSLYPLFRLGASSQTLLKIQAKSIGKDGKPPVDLKDMKHWSLVCDAAKTVPLRDPPVFSTDTNQWNLSFGLVNADLGASKTDECRVTALAGGQSYRSDLFTMSLNVKVPVNVILKPIEAVQADKAGNIKVNASIEPKKPKN